MKCMNCSWKGEEGKGPLNHCPICGDNTTGTDFKKEINIPKVNLDLNNDGKIDSKDASIASKVMNAVKRKKRKSTKKKSKR